LAVESLEDRAVPAIIFQPGTAEHAFNMGGPVINNVHPYIVFWGNGWNTGSGPAMRADLINFVNNLATSDYVNHLSEYRSSIGAGIPAAWTTFTDSSPGATFSAGDPGGMLDFGFLDGHIPDPFYHADANRLYIVIPQPGSVMNNAFEEGSDAYHAGTVFFPPPFFAPPTPAIFAAVSNDGFLDDVTNSLSHEIIEAISDPTLMAINVSPGSVFNNEIADNDAGYYTYRFDGVHLVQSWFSQADDAFIVPITNQVQNFVVSNGVLTVSGDQLANKNDSISIGTSSKGGVQVTLNGETATFEPDTISSVVVNTGTGNDTVTIGSTPMTYSEPPLGLIGSTARGLPITVNLGDGADTVNVGDSLNRLVQHGDVTVTGGSGTATLNVNDQGTQSFETYTITDNTVSRTSGGVAAIYYSHIQNLNLNTGAATETVNVQSTPAGTATTVNLGNGVDTVNVGDYLNRLVQQGAVTVNGQNGNATLNVNDQGTQSSETYTITNNMVSRTSGGVAAIYYAHIQNLHVYAGAAAETIDVQGTASGTTTTILAGTGLDNVTVNPLFGIAGPLIVDGTLAANGTRLTRLTVLDGQTFFPWQAPPAYTLTSDTIQHTGSAPITYQSLASVSLTTGIATAFPLIVNIVSTASGTDTTVTTHAGGAPNFVYVGDARKTLDGIQGQLTLDGAIFSQLFLTDTGTTADKTYIVADDTIGRVGSANIVYHNFALSLSLAGGSGQDAFEVEATSANTPVILNGGGRLNTFNLGRFTTLNDFLLPLTVNGQRTSKIVVSDGLTRTSHNYVLSPSGLARDGRGVLKFANASLSVLGSYFGNNTFTVTGAPTDFPVSFFGGAGNNTLIGPDDNHLHTWDVTGLNAGTLYDPAEAAVTFKSIQNLKGGSGDDLFAFANGASISGAVDGGGGTNSLDYLALTGNVLVDLQTGSATGVGGSIANIQNVTGGGGSNILVGDGGDVLTGGTGPNLLIAGATASKLIGGGGENILVAGTTVYDKDAVSLQAILDYWAGTDDYATRVANLTAGNGVPRLDATTVTGNGGGGTLLGGPGLDLFYGSLASDSVLNWDPATETFLGV
jgi:hypothetical protein